MKYDQPEPGEWVTPRMSGYKMACCDCGLVHRLQFKTKKFARGRKVIFRCWRDERATAAMRREAKKLTSSKTSEG